MRWWIVHYSRRIGVKYGNWWQERISIGERRSLGRIKKHFKCWKKWQEELEDWKKGGEDENVGRLGTSWRRWNTKARREIENDTNDPRALGWGRGIRVNWVQNVPGREWQRDRHRRGSGK
jgi:hypothetical protein